MERHTFDRLARMLAGATSRRSALKIAVVALVGGATLDAGDALARRKGGTCRPQAAGCLTNSQCCSAFCEQRRTAPRNQRNRCNCPDGKVLCDAECVNIASSMKYCGGCDVTCDVDRADACVSGVCSCGDGDACPEGETCIDGSCAGPCDLSTNAFCIVDTDGVVYTEDHPCIFAIANTSGCSSNADCLGLGETDWPSVCVTQWHFSDAQLASIGSSIPEADSFCMTFDPDEIGSCG